MFAFYGTYGKSTRSHGELGPELILVVTPNVGVYKDGPPSKGRSSCWPTESRRRWKLPSYA